MPSCPLIHRKGHGADRLVGDVDDDRIERAGVEKKEELGKEYGNQAEVA